MLTATRRLALGLCLCALWPASRAGAQEGVDPWPAWVVELRADAARAGIPGNFFDVQFAGLAPDPAVLRLEQEQREARPTFSRYRATRLDPLRIRLGREELQRNRALLERISRSYGVDACAILAVWGLETSYGRVRGEFPVVRSLATLAFAGRRREYFRRELLVALRILQEGHVPAERLRGEWAGGSGHPQFMPSSWERYAVDLDGDGRRDIWEGTADALASIANLLMMGGWQPGQPWGLPVVLGEGVRPESLPPAGTELPLGEWKRLGLLPGDGARAAPGPNLRGALVVPEEGVHLLVFDNHRLLRGYNGSTFYGLTAGALADLLCAPAP